MKKFIISAIALCLAVAGAGAQDMQKAKAPKTPDEKSVRFTNRLNKELNLDVNQQERVKGINLDRFKQIEEVKAQAGLDAAGRRQRMKEIEENYVSTMKGILTAEQFPKFEALRSEMKEKAFERRKGNK